MLIIQLIQLTASLLYKGRLFYSVKLFLYSFLYKNIEIIFIIIYQQIKKFDLGKISLWILLTIFYIIFSWNLNGSESKDWFMCSVNISIHFLKLIFKAVWIEKKRLWKRYLKNLGHNVNSCSLALWRYS